MQFRVGSYRPGKDKRMSLIRDNSNDPRWPKVKVVQVIPKPNALDDEPYCQDIKLSCGHSLYNTWGKNFPEKLLDEEIGCRTCFLKD